MKRRRVDTLRDELHALYSGAPENFIWDTKSMSRLLQPTRNLSLPALPRWYAYVGRAQAKRVYEKITTLDAGQEMQVLGAEGSGKSLVLSTISGYLLGSQKKNVVYICTARLIQNPHLCLLDALLVACGSSDGLVSSNSFERLLKWCQMCEQQLLFVVDDWDLFEKEPALEKQLRSVLLDHALVKVSSVNSMERYVWARSLKAQDETFTEFVDGPFDSAEYETWMSNSKLNKDKLQLQDVYRLTGHIPRLLQQYERVDGDETRFMEAMSSTYTDKLLSGFISKCRTADELRDALNLVTRGRLRPTLKGKVDFALFYREGSAYRLVSPYLQEKAVAYIRALQPGDHALA